MYAIPAYAFNEGTKSRCNGMRGYYRMDFMPIYQRCFSVGMDKAMLLLGYERSEEAGMKYLAGWLTPMVDGIPVSFVDAKEPFKYL